MGEDRGGWQGDSVKLRADEGSGVLLTGGGDLHGERESLGESGMSTSTASAGSSCSWMKQMDGSERTGMGVSDSGTGEVLSCMETAGFSSGWVLSEGTSLTGEKQRETFTVSFLLWGG